MNMACWMQLAGWEVYYVSNPTTALGVFGDLHWAVSQNGDFVDAFHTKRTALAWIETRK